MGLSRAPREQHWCDGQAHAAGPAGAHQIRWCEHESNTSSAGENSRSGDHGGGSIQRKVKCSQQAREGFIKAQKMLMKNFKNLCCDPVLKRTFLLWRMFPRYRYRARHDLAPPPLDLRVSALLGVSPNQRDHGLAPPKISKGPLNTKRRCRPPRDWTGS